MPERKEILIVPPLPTYERDLKRSAVNLGLWYIGSYLRQCGHSVKILDATLEGWDNVRKQEGLVTEFGLSDEAIVEEVEEFGPEIIGITLSPSIVYPAVIKTAQLIKDRFPQVPIIVGGTHATALPEKTLRDSRGAIDFVVAGEGELVMRNIADALGDTAKIKRLNGVNFINGNEFISNPREPLITDLDSLGPLDFSLIRHIPVTEDPTYAGPAHGKKYTDVVFSRGCPANCTFCFSPEMWRRILRTHGLDWVEDHLIEFKREGGGHIVIQDENLTRAKEPWIKGILDRLGDGGFTWDDTAGVEMESLTPELVDYMADKGCVTLFIPFNLRTEKTNKIPDKMWRHYLQVLRAAKERGIQVYTSHIMGFPEQTLQGIEEQANLARSLVESGLSDFHLVLAFSVLPGTQRWDTIMKPVGEGDYQVRQESGVVFEGGWQNWPRYSIYTPQIGSKNFSFDQVNGIYYDLIEYVNGREKSQAWFGGRQWPK